MSQVSQDKSLLFEHFWRIVKPEKFEIVLRTIIFQFPLIIVRRQFYLMKTVILIMMKVAEDQIIFHFCYYT